jgi:hypothetical protein
MSNAHKVVDAGSHAVIGEVRTWSQFMTRTVTGVTVTHVGAAIGGAIVGIVIGRVTAPKALAAVSVEATPDNVVDINVAAAE